ncbi:AraC-type DNA-binding protein [Nakamurella panacisegetis]|uniref:AraC-type DNA-binding protein n=1 Tax=Nakamurella panacisegetis TaxID=1090615 RepID=A0A1H0RX20_9ACTN|nr:AraC family transcriptional regulator [Nakamurella panacisegetis]SDP33980.1 AraC-type DNA-binding protein [Nakamurella panacisegetis]
MTPLEDVLAVAGVRGSLTAPIDAGARWGVQVDAVSEAAFHAVTEGVAYLTVPGHPTVRLMPGDVVLLPRGAAHGFASDPDEPLVPFDRMAYARSQEPGDVLLLGDRPAPTRVLCAFYAHDPASGVPLFDLLPEIISIPAAAAQGSVASTIRLLSDETSEPRMASQTIIDRLVEVLLIQVLRCWLLENDFTDASWLRGLADPVVGLVLSALHDRPEHHWTLPELASIAHVSRATLSRRFTATVGTTPSAYLTRWRMDLAAHRLRETGGRVHEIARAVGYQSEFAFSRSFARAHGIPPQRYRTEFRARR